MKKYLLIGFALCLLVSIYPVMFSEGFESTTFPPTGWSLVNLDSHQWIRATGGSNPHTGNAAALAPVGCNTSFLCSSRLTPTNEYHTLSFWARCSTTVNPYLSVLMSTGGISQAELANGTVLEPQLTVPTTYTMYNINLSAYIGSNLYICFRCPLTSSAQMYLDDVLGLETYASVGIPDPAHCLGPLNAALNISPGSSLSWSSLADVPTSYRLNLGTDGGGITPPSNICSNLDLGSATTFNPSPDLAWNTTYYWQVVPYNANGSTPNPPIWQFTTMVPDPLPYIQNFNAGLTLPADWSWSGLAFIGNMPPHGVDGSWCLSARMNSVYNYAEFVSNAKGPLTGSSELKFDYRIIDYYTMYGIALSTGDYVSVQVSTDGGVTYTELANYNSTNHVESGDFCTKTISLAAFAGSSIRVKFAAHRGTGDWFIDVDNVFITNDTVVQDYPVSESFEGDPFLPSDWQNVINSGSHAWGYRMNSVWPEMVPYNGRQMLIYESYYAGSGESASLVSPPLLTMGRDNMYSCDFWMYRYVDGSFDSNVDRVEVYSGPNPNLTGATLLATIHRSRYLSPAEATDGWYNYSFETGVGNYSYRYFIIKAISNYGNDIYLDYFTFNKTAITSAPNPAIAVNPPDNSTGIPTTTTLNWINGGNYPSGYRFYFGTDGGGMTPPVNIANNVDLGFTRTYTPSVPLANSTTYYWQIVPYNYLGSASGCPIFRFTTAHPAINITNGSRSMNIGEIFTLYDSGGPDGNYQDNENYTYTFYAPAGYLCQATFNYFNVEEGYEHLDVYNGASTEAPLLGDYTGNTSIPQLTATNPQGALTFVFTSDYWGNYSGWSANISLHIAPAAPVVSLQYISPGILHLSFPPVPGAEWYGLYFSFISPDSLIFFGCIDTSGTSFDIYPTEEKIFFRFTAGFGTQPSGGIFGRQTDFIKPETMDRSKPVIQIGK